MKRLLLLEAGLLLVLAPVVSAQFIYRFAAGAGVHPKFGINAGEIPSGTKTGVAFTGIPDIWAQGILPLDRYGEICVGLDIGYSSHAFITKPGDADTTHEGNTFTQHYRYLGIAPTFYLNVLGLGVNVGIPLGGTLRNQKGDVEKDVSTSDMGASIELRLGISAPLIKDPKGGRLNFQLFASYGLTKLPAKSYELVRLGPTPPVSDRYSPKIAALAVGLSYHFFFGVERATVE
ncbi:MAG: hypothetical protein NZ473_03005 [Candidatus Kapabacteria bacterium]|nr:hypothetical protein [Candidatus Kapabacteria bacterium]MCS7169451.1 hypothetical protein [Candidatus Kapabacteria bacterium]MDW7996320.1 hypothetical protein [Bacteroidota bacterium]MDW8225551.1 hypothetical protein [Bacteroidota bacterium]